VELQNQKYMDWKKKSKEVLKMEMQEVEWKIN
jgi:hypothetical protein